MLEWHFWHIFAEPKSVHYYLSPLKSLQYAYLLIVKVKWLIKWKIKSIVLEPLDII